MEANRLGEFGDAAGGVDGSGYRHGSHGGNFPRYGQQESWGEPAPPKWGSPTLQTMQIKNIMRTLRQGRGLTQVQLAAELGVSRSHISKVESGDDAPGRQLLEAMAVYFRVPIDTFYPIANSGGEAGDPQSEGRFAEGEVLDLWRGLDPDQKQAFLILLRGQKAREGGDSA